MTKIAKRKGVKIIGYMLAILAGVSIVANIFGIEGYETTSPEETWNVCIENDEYHGRNPVVGRIVGPPIFCLIKTSTYSAYRSFGGSWDRSYWSLLGLILLTGSIVLLSVYGYKIIKEIIHRYHQEDKTTSAKNLKGFAKRSLILCLVIIVLFVVFYFLGTYLHEKNTVS